MSITGRNAHRGSSCVVYRPVETNGPGAQITTMWETRIAAVRLALHSVTDDIVRRVYGEEADIAVMVMIPARLAIAKDDAIRVTAGEYEGQTFRVVAARSMNRFLELGLQSMTEPLEHAVTVTRGQVAWTGKTVTMTVTP